MMEKNFEKSMKITDFNIEINKENVMALAGCRRGDPVCSEIEEELPELAREMIKAAAPRAYIRFGMMRREEHDDTVIPAVYVLVTAGCGMEQISDGCFKAGEYLSGLLADAIADDYLFQVDGQVMEAVKAECALRHLGVAGRLEAPADIPPEFQQTIMEESGAAEDEMISMTRGFMFCPVKTMAYVLVLTDDEKTFNAQHDCKKCGAKDCRMRKDKTIMIKTVNSESGEETWIECAEGQNLLEAMTGAGVYISAPCGGKGTCGKCRVRITEGRLDASPFERMQFSRLEIKDGLRLACRAYPKSECTVVYGGGEDSFRAVAEFAGTDLSKSPDHGTGDAVLVIAADIGTTTIAISLVEKESRRVVHTVAMINRQRAYGADVIARMQASNEGRRNELQSSIRRDLKQGIDRVLSETAADRRLVEKMAIGCNMTMTHLLLGYPCSTLGVYPFTPVNTGTVEMSLEEILGTRMPGLEKVMAVVLPGISAFVGGDIVAGLLACGFAENQETGLLIDLGTNGEMAIGNSDRILVSSAAAGPAFEGGNISCGVGSVDGAVCSAEIRRGTGTGNASIGERLQDEPGGGEQYELNYETIGRKPPVGICGTGVIEIASELISSKIADETGLMDEKYLDDGYKIADGANGTPIVFTQKDLRELQLAKSAIRAGVETLILKYGISYGDIGTVYLAGGFGFRMNIEKALRIGLLPVQLKGKIKAVGNSSLGGAIRYLTDEHAERDVEKILHAAEEVSLSNQKEFQELYLEHMFF